jgi:hypothetical protein
VRSSHDEQGLSVEAVSHWFRFNGVERHSSSRSKGLADAALQKPPAAVTKAMQETRSGPGMDKR